MKNYNPFKNTFYVKIFFILVPFLAEIPLLMSVFNPTIKIGLVWSAAIIIIDFFTSRRIMKSRYAMFMICIVLFYGITIAININEHLWANLWDYFYLFVLFFVMYPPSLPDESKERECREVKAISVILVVLTTAAALAGLFLFIIQYTGYTEYAGVSYPVGFVQNRLNGLYRNAIYPSGSIGMFAAVMLIVTNRKNAASSSRRVLKNILLSLSALANFCQICLANSKGLFIGIAGAVFILAGFLMHNALAVSHGKWKKAFFVIVRSATCLLAGVFGVAVMLGSVTAVRTAAPSVALSIQKKTEKSGNPVPEAPANLNRDEIAEDYGLFTGRVKLWVMAFERFTEKPVFGYGAYTLGKLTIPNVNEHWPHFHNVYINALVAFGLVGTIPLMAIFILSLMRLLKYLYMKRHDTYYHAVLGILSILTFLMIVNLADTTIMFMIKQSSFVFWMYLGYAVRLSGSPEPGRADKPVFRLAELLDRKSVRS